MQGRFIKLMSFQCTMSWSSARVRLQACSIAMALVGSSQKGVVLLAVGPLFGACSGQHRGHLTPSKFSKDCCFSHQDAYFLGLPCWVKEFFFQFFCLQGKSVEDGFSGYMYSTQHFYVTSNIHNIPYDICYIPKSVCYLRCLMLQIIELCTRHCPSSLCYNNTYLWR